MRNVSAMKPKAKACWMIITNGNDKTKTKFVTKKPLSEVKYMWQPKPPFGHTSEMIPGCGKQILLVKTLSIEFKIVLVFSQEQGSPSDAKAIRKPDWKEVNVVEIIRSYESLPQ